MVAQSKTFDHFVERCVQAYEQSLTGDFSLSDKLISALASNDRPLIQVWRSALQAQRWHADPDEGVLPSLSQCADFVEQPPDIRSVAVVLSAQAAARAVLAHDVAELRAWVELQDRLLPDLDDPLALGKAELCKAWLALADGKPKQADVLAEQAIASASENGMRAALIEGTVLRTHAAEQLGDLERATASARTATRMAQAEDLPQSQYLAGLALARIRRLNGMPHLSARILRPMLEVAPPPWLAWIAWEALMAGAPSLADEISLGDSHDPRGVVRLMKQVVSAAHQGDLQALTSASSELQSASGLWHSRRGDARWAVATLDPTTSLTTVEGPLRSWLCGETASPPNAVKGFCVDPEADDGTPGPGAVVVAGPAGSTGYATPRRVACFSEPLLSQHECVERVKGKFERVVTSIAAIALAGAEGIDNRTLFQGVYGFAYRPELHLSALRMLRHRVRQMASAYGTLIYEDGRYSLDLRVLLVIPDPRCSQSLDDSVLRVFARLGATGAKQAAENLGVPLRTLQTALKALVDEGALQIERKGRQFEYRVEDTTFSEPTKWSARLPQDVDA